MIKVISIYKHIYEAYRTGVSNLQRNIYMTAWNSGVTPAIRAGEGCTSADGRDHEHAQCGLMTTSVSAQSTKSQIKCLQNTKIVKHLKYVGFPLASVEYETIFTYCIYSVP